MLTKISQKKLAWFTWTETIVIDTDVNQGSDTETINYFEDDDISKMITETLNEQQQIPQKLLDSLARIGRTPSPPPQGDEPEKNKVNELETIITNDDSHIDFNILRTTNGVEITNSNDNNNGW